MPAEAEAMATAPLSAHGYTFLITVNDHPRRLVG
jgi:hypothetical protein